MRKLKIMWSIFWSEKLIRFYMIVSILLIIITSNILFALLREEYTLNKISNGCDFDQAVYFSRSTSVPYAEKGTKYDMKVDGLLKEIEKNAFSIGKITYLYTYIEAVEENAFLLDYNETVIKHLKFPLSKGRWFREDACNEAILSYKYKKRYDIGDRVPLVITDASGRHELEVEVIGFLDQSDYMMNFTSSGYVDMGALIGQEKSAIITSGLKDVNGQACEPGDNSGVLIFGPITQNNGYYEKLMEFGAVTTMDEVAENYQENVKKRLYNLIGINAVLFVLAFSGLGSMNFISLYTKRKEYGVYFICGLSRKMVAFMTAIADLVIMAFAFIPATVFCLFNPDIIPNFDFVNVAVTVVIIGFILIVSFIPFYMITKKDSVISLIRR